MRLSLACFSVLAACNTPAPSEGQDSGGPLGDSGISEPAAPVTATIQVLNPMTGGGMKGIAISGGLEDVSTQTGGAAEVFVAADEAFELLLESDKILDHLLVGTAGSQDFELITFAGTPSTSEAVLGMLGISWAPETGMVVIGVDYSNWAPVVGAQVTLSDSNAESFVLAGNGMPSLSDTIPSGGMGMVSFVNVPAGEVSVEVLPPEGVTCRPHPGGSHYDAIPVEPGKVTVASLQCQDESAD